MGSADAADLWVNTNPRPNNWAQVSSATFDPNGAPDTIQQGSWDNTINGSGLTFSGGTWHNNLNQNSSTYVFDGWSVDPIQNSNVGFVVYQFAQTYTIESIDFWGANTVRGIRRAWFWTQDATTGEWTQRLNGASMDWDFARVTTGDAPPEVITGLNWTNVSAIRFEPRSTTSNSGMEVDEIQFTINSGVTPDPYTVWLNNPPHWTLAGPDAEKTADPDGDGMTNQQEFAFGLDPTKGSSCDPITMALNQATGKFSYTRLAASGLAYHVFTSTNLQTWAEEAYPVNETVSDPDLSGVVTAEVTVAALPADGRLFVRVATQ